MAARTHSAVGGMEWFPGPPDRTDIELAAARGGSRRPAEYRSFPRVGEAGQLRAACRAVIGADRTPGHIVSRVTMRIKVRRVDNFPECILHLF